MIAARVLGGGAGRTAGGAGDERPMAQTPRLRGLRGGVHGGGGGSRGATRDFPRGRHLALLLRRDPARRGVQRQRIISETPDHQQTDSYAAFGQLTYALTDAVLDLAGNPLVPVSGSLPTITVDTIAPSTAASRSARADSGRE